MFCRKCGAGMADEAAFCPNCGNPVLREQEEAGNGPGYGWEADTALPPGGAGAYAAPGPAPRRKKRGGLIAVVIALAVLLLAAGAAGGFLLWKSLSGTKEDQGPDPERAPVFYLTQSGELKYHTPSQEEPVLLAGGYSTEEFDRYMAVYGTAASDSGEVIAYLRGYTAEYDGDLGGDVRMGELCLRETGKKTGEDTLVERGVQQFLLSSDGKALWYTTADGISLYDIEKREVTGLDPFSGTLIDCWSSQRLLYERTTMDGETYYQDYYIVDMGGGAPEKRKLDTSISEFGSYSEDLSRFIYTKYIYDPDSQSGTTEVYYIGENGDKKRIFSGDMLLYYSDAETGEIVYTRRRESGVSVGEFISDDMADVDAGWMEPKVEDYQIVRESLFGGSYTTTNYDAYNAAWAEYEQKLFRDEVRQAIEEQDGPVYVNDLIRQVGEEETVLAQGIDDCIFYDPEQGMAVYRRSDLENIGPAAVISQITSADEVYTVIGKIQYGRPADVCAVKEGGEPAVLFQSGGEEYVSVSMGPDGLYAMQIPYEDGSAQGALWYAPVSQTAIGPAGEVDREAESFLGKVCGHPAYYRPQEGDSSGQWYDLYLLQDGSGTLLLENVGMGAGFQPMGEEGCYLMSGYDWERQCGELYRYDGENPPRWLASDVYSVWGRSAFKAYLLKDYAQEKGDLYLYEEGGQPRLIDREVVAVFSRGFAQYR